MDSLIKPREYTIVMAILLASVGVSVYAGVATSYSDFLRFSSLTIREIHDAGDGNIALRDGQFAALASGQLWRLFTPTFIHISLGHLLHNLLFVPWFCARIEAERGSLAFMLGAGLVAGAANVSNLIWSGMPFFGGASTLWCAAFGYRGVVMMANPKSVMAMSAVAIAAAIASFAIGFLGLVPAANTLHVAALIVGAALGIPVAVHERRSMKKQSCTTSAAPEADSHSAGE